MTVGGEFVAPHRKVELSRRPTWRGEPR